MKRVPYRDVVRIKELHGPRGGVIYVMALECKCIIWKRTKTPPTRVRCIPCWWEAEEKKPLAEEKEEE